MYSVNVAVPGRVRQLANELYPRLTSFSSIRQEHSILVKRLGPAEEFGHLSQRTRAALEGTPPIEARITGIDYFSDPPRGPDPVVYLALDSPGLDAVHARLVDELGAIAGLEGDEYTMHVTLARGGDLETAERLAERSVEPIRWTIDELKLWDAHRDRAVGTISLPA